MAGFRSDNGSKYINHDVAHLLGKLLMERITPSRARAVSPRAVWWRPKMEQ